RPEGEGSVSERPKVRHSKCRVVQATVGSNPTATAGENGPESVRIRAFSLPDAREWPVPVAGGPVPAVLAASRRPGAGRPAGRTIAHGPGVTAATDVTVRDNVVVAEMPAGDGQSRRGEEGSHGRPQGHRSA